MYVCPVYADIMKFHPGVSEIKALKALRCCLDKNRTDTLSDGWRDFYSEDERLTSDCDQNLNSLL